MRKIIDEGALDRLQEVIGGDREDLQELLDEFHGTASVTVDQMRDAARVRDFDRLRIAAHGLKSNACDFGATRLAGLCGRLERECRDGRLVAPAQSVSVIAEELAAACRALRDMEAQHE